MAKNKRVRSCCSSSTPSKPESKSDWEGLPGHLLDLILDKLAINLSDYYRFGVVCKAWKSCMLDHYTRNRITLTAHHLPFLLLGSRSSPDDAESLCFYNFSTGEICKFKLDIKPFSKFDYETFCGSSYGWLIFMENCVPTLSNPLSGAFFSLPALDVSRFSDGFDTFTLSRDPSLGSFEVLASSYGNVLGHFKSGDESWTYLENWKSDYFDFESFIFTRDHILAVSAPDDRSDLDENNLSLHIISRDIDPLSKGSIKEIPKASKESDGENRYVSSYFVETTSGDLLMVLRYYELDDNLVVGTFKAYKIYKLIGLGLEEQVELVQIEDLGSDCLFLGDYNNHSISVLASNYPKFMPNTIIHCSARGLEDITLIEVFNLKDGIVSSCCLPKEYSLVYGTNLMVPSIKL